MSNRWIPDTIAGFCVTRVSRAERMRRTARRVAKSKRARTIAAFVPLIAGALTVIRIRRGKNASA